MDKNMSYRRHLKGGRYLGQDGYWRLFAPDHPRASGNYVLEHIVVAEKAFGGPLPAEAQVHHCGEKSDNSKLVICEDQAYHRLLHVRMRALAECGDANKRKCTYCKQYDDVENLRVPKTTRLSSHHPECQRAYSRKRYRDNAPAMAAAKEAKRLLKVRIF